MSTITMLTVSRENISVADVRSAVVKLMPEFSSRIQAFNQNKTVKLSSKSLFTVDFSKRDAKRLSEKTYVSYRDKVAFIPPGLNATYLDYLKVLEKSNVVCTEIISKHLRPFRNWLDEVTTNPKLLERMSTRQIDEIKADFKDTMASFEKVFGESTQKDRTRVADVVQRSKDWIEIQSRLEDLLNEDDIPTRKEVIEEMDAVTKSVDNFIQSLGGDNSKVSKATLKAMADSTLAVSNYLELYVYHIYSLSALVNAIHDTSEHLKK